jgi:hypothetical protein
MVSTTPAVPAVPLATPGRPSAPAPPATPSRVVPPPPPGPFVTSPIMGGVINGTVWVGGKPSSTWDSTGNQKPQTPYAYRLEGEKSLKIYTYLTNGQTHKFKRDDEQYALDSFSADAFSHMKKGGMDSVWYFPDPTDSDSMLSLFEYHSLFTLEYVTKTVKRMRKSTYDQFDVDNLEHSRSWIESSLDITLWNSIRPQVTSDLSGPEVYMVLVSEVQSDSIQSMRAKERKLEGMKLKDYPGENVRLLNVEILKLCSALEANKSLPRDMILTIVDKYTESTCMVFSVHFMQRRSAVEAFMRATAGKDPSVIAQMVDPITYRTLVQESSAKYQSLLDTSKWPASSTANDRGGAPDLLACIAKLESKVDAVLHQRPTYDGGRDKSSVKCHNCGAVGHYRNECPKDSVSKTPHWKTISPPAGEAETKHVNDKDWHWCGVCKRWSTTHGTIAKESPKGKIPGHTGGTSGHPAPDPAPAPAPASSPAPASEANAANACGSLLGNFSAW